MTLYWSLWKNIHTAIPRQINIFRKQIYTAAALQCGQYAADSFLILSMNSWWGIRLAWGQSKQPRRT